MKIRIYNATCNICTGRYSTAAVILLLFNTSVITILKNISPFQMTYRYSANQLSSSSMSLNSRFKTLLDEATYHQLAGPNRDIIMLLCDFICKSSVEPKFALENLTESLYSPDSQVVLQSLHILQAWVNNCGTVIHNEVASKAFLDQLLWLLSVAKDENVRDRILGMLQSWEYMFQNEPCYRAVHEAVDRTKNKGYTFPELKDEDTLFTVDQYYRNATLAHQVLSKDWQVAASSNLAVIMPTRSKSPQKQVHYEPNVSTDEELQSLRDKVSCSICMENEKNYALVPCGHQFCRTCIDTMRNQTVGSPFQCPVCKTDVQTAIRVYL